MKLKKYAYLFKTDWKLYFINNEKIPGNLLKNLEKSWKYHGILSVRKSGNPAWISFCSLSVKFSSEYGSTA